MSTILYIAAKAPRVGLAKTRLGRQIGHERAVALYAAFLRDLAARFAGAPFALGWYVTPPDAWIELAPLLGRAGHEERLLPQPSGDWTERQATLFRAAAGRGEQRLVLIASDSPHITVEMVRAAFGALERHDLVVGPTYDGGYYLLGMRGWHDVLQGVPMSTHTVADDLTARARHAGLSVGILPSTFDVDEADDLPRLWQMADKLTDLAATRAALIDLHLRPARRNTMTGAAETTLMSATLDRRWSQVVTSQSAVGWAPALAASSFAGGLS